MKHQLQLKTELLQSVGIKQRLGVLVETVIALVVRFEDYAFYKGIKLSEGLLLIIAVCRAPWYSMVGVQNANFDYFFPDYFWVVISWAMLVLHLLGLLTCFKMQFKLWRIFNISSKTLRVAGIYLQAFVYIFLFVMALIARTTAFGLPFNGIFFVFSIVVIVRLSREDIVDE